MIVIKTEAGHQVIKDRSVPLTPRQRSALILVDGKRTLEQLLAATTAAGVARGRRDEVSVAGSVMPVIISTRQHRPRSSLISLSAT